MIRYARRLGKGGRPEPRDMPILAGIGTMDSFDIKIAVGDSDFNWAEAERLAALPDFGVLAELRKLREEVENG